MGFATINKLAKKLNIEVNKKKFNALYGSGIVNGQKIILIKPQTYMNLSGEAVKPFMDFYKVKPENIIVIYDDIDIETGTIKIRKKGGAGTHNGMKSVVHELNTEEFPRIRVGTGSKEKIFNLINYVITRVDDDEYNQKSEIEDAKQILEMLKNYWKEISKKMQ